MSDDRKSLGARLREAREYLGLSQDDVAKTIDLPRPAVSLIESGRRRVDALELKKFASLYQRSVSYFTSSEEEVGAGPLAENVQHLARTVAKLTPADQVELLRFAEFLTTRSRE